ncbi:MAG: PPC domain-containing DNA-binding protein [Candidatus Bathyarchaeales archaeon]
MAKGTVGKIHFFRLFEDEDLVEAIRERAEKNGVNAGILFVIGTLKDAVLGYYLKGEYKYIRLDEPLEIASCMGNIALDEDSKLVVHAHIVVSNEKGEAFGGHLMQNSHVAATAELVIIEADGLKLQRAFDAKTKLKLLRLS